MLIAISENVAEDVRIIDRIKEVFTQASALLYKVTSSVEHTIKLVHKDHTQASALLYKVTRSVEHTIKPIYRDQT